MIRKEPITNNGYIKLQNEIKYFKEVSIPAVIEDIKISASYGDLTENAEYEAAIESQEFLLTRLGELQLLLSKLIVINPEKSEHGKITFGSTFELNDINTDENFIYTLVGGYESDPSKGLISYSSPLAKFFIGKEVDDEVAVSINNNTIYYEIEKVYYDDNRIALKA